MAVFIVVTLAIHGLTNYYILRRGWQALAGFPKLRIALTVLFLLSLLAYPLGRTIMALANKPWSAFLIRAGSYHLALMLYLFLFVLIIDAVRLIHAFFPFFPRFLTADPQRTGTALFLIVFGISVLTVLGGAVNGTRMKVRALDLTVEKRANGMEELKIVMASDIHLGVTISPKRLRRIVGKINSLEPDIVLLAGDIVDETMTGRHEENMTAAFSDLEAPLGTFAVPGNHEFYSGLERNLAFLRGCGIRVLEDEAVLVDDSFFIIGRRDPSSLPKGGRRSSIEDILADGEVDERLPLILLDHQPLRLEEASDAGIDLQLSGHTHAGQLFPLNIINKRVYEQNWGYLKKGRTQVYVSCGVCTWGPPVRTGSIPEVVVVRVVFEQPS